MVNSINGNNFPQWYLQTIKNDAFKRMDSVRNGGNGDGKVNTYEAFQDLDIGRLFNGLQENSEEYNRLKDAAADITNVLEQYAGDDGEFTAEEWAAFLNGDEWTNVLDAYHSTTEWSRKEMDWIDNSEGMYHDGKTTKGEVKVGFRRDIAEKGIDVDTTSFGKLIDKYAGDDGIFTVEEYTSMRNDPIYKAFIEKFHIVPYHSVNFEDESREEIDNDAEN